MAGNLGHLEKAIALIGRAIRVAPTVAEYHNNLGEFYRRSGQRTAAIACFHRAIAIKPGLVEAHNNLGIALKDEGRLDEASAACTRATELKPDNAEAHNNLGNALSRAGQGTVGDRRLPPCEDALRPDHADAHGNLGRRGPCKDGPRRRGDRRLPDRATVRLRPDDPGVHSNLGVALHRAGLRDEAGAAFFRAIELQPGHAEAHTNLGNLGNDLGRPDLAIAALGRAIELQSGRAEPYNNLGNAFKEQGRLDEALAAYRRAVAVQPGFSMAASSFLTTLQYHPDYDAHAILAEHRQWAGQFAAPLAAEIRPHRNDRNPERRLRVGFLSPDFRSHAGRELALLALFANCDRRQTEIYAYADVRAADRVTTQLESLADRWHNTVGLSDPQLAGLIRDEQIDILVDLALHTADNRMLVFARKPAPVEATMLGLPATTGLPTMDYRLTDAFLDPPDADDDVYTEKSIRLPHSFWVYPPPDHSPPTGPLPAEQNGFVTLGCLNHFAKVSRQAWQLWFQILQAVPTARLVVQCPPGGHRNALRAQFRDEGIALDRVAFAPEVPHLAYLERLAALDLALDPFPYNGHTSTLDALWMGVPVITLAGRTAVGRGGVSILSNVGLPELIAETPEQYVDLAVQWATDWPRLSRLRATLRRTMLASPLTDRPRFAADVESALRRMWQAWCGLSPSQYEL